MELLIWPIWPTMRRWRRPTDRVGAHATSDPGLQGRDASIGDECEHFLAGTYEAYLLAHDRPVPLWARVNAVAHADLVSLIAMASRPQPARSRRKQKPTWEAARAQMAEALLRSAAAQDAAPWEVQQDALVPLESLLARGARQERSWRIANGDPKRLVAIVDAALQQPR